MSLAPGSVIGGKYRIERPLARGGMGSVWVARHVQLGSEVALKFLDPRFAASASHRTRFEREARAAANLKSPHVVHVSDYGFEGDAPYLVMELLEGEDLGQRLQRAGRLTIPDTTKILTQVSKALRKAHEAGIAHRDLKPANLFLARVDDEEIVKVLDFGIAKESSPALGDATKTGEVMGSPHYMSPEQVRAEKDLDHRTDLWALGVIVYRMLVGELPFPGDQIGPVFANILTAPIPVPSRAAPDLPPLIDGFIARALARDKTQRFQSVGEMVEAFKIAASAQSAAIDSTAVLPSGFAPAQAALTGSVPQGVARQNSSLGAPEQNGSQGVAGQSGPFASTGGTDAGISRTGPTRKPRSAGLVVAIGFALLGVAVPIAFLVLRSSPAEPAGTTSAAPITVPLPSELTTGTLTAGVVPAASTTATSTSAAPTNAPAAPGSPATSISAAAPPPTSTAPPSSSAGPKPAAPPPPSSQATTAPVTTAPATTAKPAATPAPTLTEKWW